MAPELLQFNKEPLNLHYESDTSISAASKCCKSSTQQQTRQRCGGALGLRSCSIQKYFCESDVCDLKSKSSRKGFMATFTLPQLESAKMAKQPVSTTRWVYLDMSAGRPRRTYRYVRRRVPADISPHTPLSAVLYPSIQPRTNRCCGASFPTECLQLSRQSKGQRHTGKARKQILNKVE